MLKAAVGTAAILIFAIRADRTSGTKAERVHVQ
jgi:hypothetical protein